jgi:tryptophan synthase alpha chain
MSRIASTFRRLSKANEAALIPYLWVDDDSLERTRWLLPVLARQSADLIALGIPDYGRATGRDLSLADCLAVAAEARRTNELPLLLASNYTPILKHGVEKFAAGAAASGVDGVIALDLRPGMRGTSGVRAGPRE